MSKSKSKLKTGDRVRLTSNKKQIGTIDDMLPGGGFVKIRWDQNGDQHPNWLHSNHLELIADKTDPDPAA